MEIVILAAGKGERLKPLTDVKPKPMIKIMGKSIIERIIEDTYSFGVKRFVVVAEYKYDLMSKHLSSIAEKLGIDVEMVRQGAELGTGHALLEALPHISSDAPLVVYGDLFL
jgi:NDP-sugar pyrophosphorylase family protein